MGLLSIGTPLAWEEAKPYAKHVHEHGITQFINIYNRMKDKRGDVLLWGDEIEYMVVDMDDEHRNARLSLRVKEILSELQEEEINALKAPIRNSPETTWHPEYGRYMLEATPAAPYGSTFRDLLRVEANMRLRRRIAKQHMRPQEIPVTLTSFPRLGAPGQFLEPHYEPGGDVSRSLFVPDEIINSHARFPTLTANIRRRRGSKVAINMPIFHDTNTPRPFIDPTIPKRDLYPEDAEAHAGAALPDHIYMDAMCFGMGCCCLQITFQAFNIDEARRLYDQLANMTPIMLALTAAAPIYRGYLSDVDCRWNVIAGSVDDRTPEERGERPLEHDRFRIPKSRYDSIDSYLSMDEMFRPEYNDIDLVYDEEIFSRLRSEGIDELLARHIAHLFIRDPLVIYRELVTQDDATSSDHFENIQSTNWQTLRFKPPPPNSPIGWRVEFRSMEIQLTDFENAAFAVFIVLLTRVILSFGLNLYIPISKVDENMQNACKRAAVTERKFWFRKDVIGKKAKSNGYSSHTSTPSSSRAASPAKSLPVEEEYELMTVDEIMNGKPSANHPGLIPLITSYLNSAPHLDIETRCELTKYLDLVRQRANGTLLTPAGWMRKFVRSHPLYRADSVVSQEVCYDLVREVEAINKGEVRAPELLGSWTPPKDDQ